MKTPANSILKKINNYKHNICSLKVLNDTKPNWTNDFSKTFSGFFKLHD